MHRWMALSVKAAALVAVLAVTALGVAALRWRTATEDLRAQLRAMAQPPAASVYSARDVESLPAPVRRYFAVALSEGQPLATHAGITWEGEFNMGRPGADRWAPFTAVQDVVPGAPGMVWDARIAMPPALTVRVRDAFVDGQGSMRGAVLGVVTVVNQSGTRAMAVASLQRYLAEAPWYPTALLPASGVGWTAIDDTRALATISVGAVRASVEFRFGADGLPASVFVPDRLYDDGRTPPTAHPWEGRNLSFMTRDGMRIPDRAIVEWHLPGGTYAYWRARPRDLVYEWAPG